MSETHGTQLLLEWKPTGRTGMATVTTKRGDEVLELDTFDLTKTKSRERYADKVCGNRPGVDRTVVEAELLRMAEQASTSPTDRTPAADVEVDTRSIIRPEQFHTAEVSGFAIPTITTVGDGLAGRWQWYVRWRDGRRVMQPLAKKLDLPDGGRLLSPIDPGDPSLDMASGWSAEARRQWLEGRPAPNPSEVFRAVCRSIAYYLDLPKTEARGVTSTLALWTMFTYVYSAWPAVPYLSIGGAMGSGKSSLFAVLERMVFRPLVSSSMTAASLFRTLHARGGTLLLDEAERFKNSKSPEIDEQVSMLLAGYKRGGSAIRLEPQGDGRFKPTTFSVFGPKAMACISGLPPTLASRAIQITMFRAAPGSRKPVRRIDASPMRWQTLRDALHAVALEYGPRWLELAGYTDVCPPMGGREFELWQPILAIASFMEEAGARGLLKQMQDHALATVEATKDDQTPEADETLLRLMVTAVKIGSSPTPGELLDEARASDPETFRRWSPKGISERYKRYGLRTNKTAGRKVYSTVTPHDLMQIERNYGIDLGVSQAG